MLTTHSFVLSWSMRFWPKSQNQHNWVEIISYCKIHFVPDFYIWSHYVHITGMCVLSGNANFSVFPFCFIKSVLRFRKRRKFPLRRYTTLVYSFVIQLFRNSKEQACKVMPVRSLCTDSFLFPRFYFISHSCLLKTPLLLVMRGLGH